MLLSIILSVQITGILLLCTIIHTIIINVKQLTKYSLCMAAYTGLPSVI